VLLLVILIGGGAWCIFQIARPPEVPIVAGSESDGVRAQQKIFDMVRRAGSGRSQTTTLSEPEVNAFVRHHLGGEADLPLRNLGVHLLGGGQAEIIGQVSLRRLLGLPPFSVLTSVMPERALDHAVWLTLLTSVTLEARDGARDRRRVRLDVKRFRLGRLPLPGVMVRLLFDPSALRLLRWSMPRGIDGIRIEPGRLILHAGT
jgi:hypothetical protein